MNRNTCHYFAPLETLNNNFLLVHECNRRTKNGDIERTFVTEEERRNNTSTRVVLASSTGKTERYVLVDVLPETAAEKNLCDTGNLKLTKVSPQNT